MAIIISIVVIAALIAIGYFLGAYARGRQLKRRERQLAAVRRELAELTRSRRRFDRY
jgi:type II secretory pathway pseudopilin PulG